MSLIAIYKKKSQLTADFFIGICNTFEVVSYSVKCEELGKLSADAKHKQKILKIKFKCVNKIDICTNENYQEVKCERE